jgi:hypothetical protein
MGVEAFQHHWKTEHGPTAGAIPNLQRYVQHHAILGDGHLLLPYPGFDACSELDFAGLAEMDDGFAQMAATGELAADEDRFVDKSRYTWVLGEAVVRRPTPPLDDHITLVTWWRSHSASGSDRLVELMLGEWDDAIIDAVAGRRLVVARDDWHAGRQPPSAAVVEILSFDGIAAATGFLNGAAQTAAPLLAGVAFGTERHLARPAVILGLDDPSP